VESSPSHQPYESHEFFISLNLLYHTYPFEATSVQVTFSTCILEENMYNTVGNNNIKKWTPDL
jgi:hypothetical protein